MSRSITTRDMLILEASGQLAVIKTELNNKDPKFIRAWLKIAFPDITNSWTIDLIVEALEK